jgi:hypothetical protein
MFNGTLGGYRSSLPQSATGKPFALLLTAAAAVQSASLPLPAFKRSNISDCGKYLPGKDCICHRIHVKELEIRVAIIRISRLSSSTNTAPDPNAAPIAPWNRNYFGIQILFGDKRSRCSPNLDCFEFFTVPYSPTPIQRYFRSVYRSAPQEVRLTTSPVKESTLVPG